MRAHIRLDLLPTNDQAEVLDDIDRYERKHSRSPTIRELARLRGVHHNAVVGHLRRLRELGYLNWQRGRSRTLVRPGGLLVLGEVSAIR